MIISIATAVVRAEARDSFKHAARARIALARRQHGCLAYDVHESVTEPGRFVFVERWGGDETGTAQPASRHTRDFLEMMGDAVTAADVMEVVTRQKHEPA
jgi:quinol monooxygenase YgiN